MMQKTDHSCLGSVTCSRNTEYNVLRMHPHLNVPDVGALRIADEVL